MWPFFLISSMFLGLLDHLQIFSQLYLIELLRLLTCLRLLKLWHFIYPRLLTKFAMLVFFINLSLMEFQVRNFVTLLFFSVIHSFEWFWIESLHKNIQLMLEFLKAPFWLLHFLRYINDLPNDVICDIAIYADDTTLCSKCDQASVLSQQSEVASELKSDLQNPVDWGKISG